VYFYIYLEEQFSRWSYCRYGKLYYQSSYIEYFNCQRICKGRSQITSHPVEKVTSHPTDNFSWEHNKKNPSLLADFQRVLINGSYSDCLPVASGVPQSSVLGPLLFILYIDDLKIAVCYSTLKLFADDATLYREIKSSADCLLLQKDLYNIYSWTIKWQLHLSG